MQSTDVGEAQLAVTTYLVDKLALRAGGEKDDDLADTVGVCTLRVRNLIALAERMRLALTAVPPHRSGWTRHARAPEHTEVRLPGAIGCRRHTPSRLVP
jgi:hypothetical protein